MAKKSQPQAARRGAAAHLPKAAGGKGPRTFRAIDGLLLLCFFCSGATALIYEALWTRMITSVIGGAPFAVAIVLTIFMGGIGAGSFLAGKIADRQESPRALVRLYAILELIIGGYALLVPLIVIALKPLYSWIYNLLFDHFFSYNLLTFAGCCLTLAVPVLCMGATLPLLCRHQVRDLRRVGSGTGLLYALNTAGAAVGALLGGVILVPKLGVWGTLALAAGVNVAIGFFALRLARREPAGVVAPKPVPATANSGPAVSAEKGNKLVVVGALIIFGVSGFCSMSYEVIWTKLLSLVVGPTNYSFTIILVSFILGLALGSFVFGRLGDRVTQPETLLVATQIAAALLALLISQLLGGSQLLFAKLLFAHPDSFAAQNLMKALALMAFLILPTLCLGATFPLVGKIVSRNLANVGRTIGRAYAINSAGAVVGSFAAGFLLIPWLGKEHSLSLTVALQLTAALAVATMIWARWRWPLALKLGGVTIAIAGLIGTAFFPRWNHLVLSSSKYHRLDGFGPLLRSTGWWNALLNGSQILAQYDPSELVFYGEGIGGFTTVSRNVNALGSPEYRMANSGKFDASSRGDMNTQVLSGHVPMLSHPNPRSVLVIGLASGVTVGEVLNYPVEHVDIVEINEQAARASDFFTPWNNRALADPRSQLIIQDARAHVRLSPRTYDVIISEPSNPWMAGCAALFTRDFFQDAKDRLSDNGCFIQWLQAYQIDWASVELIGRTFLDVFPGSTLLSTQPTRVGSDYLLIGFKGGGGFLAEAAQRNLLHAQKSSNLVLKDPRVLYRLVVSDNCEGVFGPGPLNTDNRPLLEFSAPRHLHRGRASAGEVIERLLRQQHLHPSAQAYVDSAARSVDAQLDFAEFALSVFEPFAGMFDPARATEDQKTRFTQMLERYCETNEIDLALIPDGPLRQRCVARQLEIVQAQGASVPTNGDVLFYRATLHKAAEQMEPALEYYRRSAQLNPLDVRPLNEIGIILCQNGQVPEGIKQFQKVLEIEPRQAEAHVNLATAYFNTREPMLAQSHFREALRIDPNHLAAREGLRVLQSRRQR